MYRPPTSRKSLHLLRESSGIIRILPQSQRFYTDNCILAMNLRLPFPISNVLCFYKQCMRTLKVTELHLLVITLSNRERSTLRHSTGRACQALNRALVNREANTRKILLGRQKFLFLKQISTETTML